MAFENVNVTSLKSALVSCKNAINYSTSKELISSISNSNVWLSDSKNNLKRALEKLNNLRYKELEKKLDDYLSIATKMSEYKDLEAENKNLELQYSNLSNRLYYTERYTTHSTDSEGNVETEEHSRRSLDYGVQNQMNFTRNKINENKQRMEILKNNISNLI